MIAKLSYKPLSLKLSTPIITSRFTLTERKCFLITIHDGKNNRFFGLSAPFQEMGSETYNDAEILLNILSTNFTSGLSVSDYEETIKTKLANSPAVKCGLEQALHSYKRFHNLQPSAFENCIRIKISSLVNYESKNDLYNKTFALLKNGIRNIKLKFGVKSFNEESEILEFLNTSFKNELDVRLDINGNWNYKDAKTYLNELEDFPIQYVEQPVSDSEDLIKLSHESSIPIAPDESIRNTSDANRLLTEGNFRYVVIKPMMIGGLDNTLALNKIANENDAKLIISSSIENSLGKSFLIYVAAMLNNDEAHGLDMTRQFKDYDDFEFLIRSGYVHISDEVYNSLNYNEA